MADITEIYNKLPLLLQILLWILVVVVCFSLFKRLIKLELFLFVCILLLIAIAWYLL